LTVVVLISVQAHMMYECLKLKMASFLILE
jgi:hypothetical protein